MKGDAKVIEFLNKAIVNELTAINQYFLHSKILKNWGLERLARHTMEESVDEMKHAELLTERVLFLEGTPNLQGLHRLRIGATVEEMLQSDLALEVEDAIPLLREAIAYCHSINDFGTRSLFQQILEEEERHVDFLETQQEKIRLMGLQNYTQQESSATP